MKVTVVESLMVVNIYLTLLLPGGQAATNASSTADLIPWSTQQPRYSEDVSTTTTADPLLLILADLPNTTHHISITGNEQIITLEDNIFSSFRELSRTVLRSNDIATVSPTAFEGCPITLLDLSKNNLTGLPNLTAISSTLESLIVSKNPIKTVTFDKWVTFPNLILIDLTSCALVHMPRFNVSLTAPKLEELLLKKNKIVGLALGDMVSLVYSTSLEYNKIDKLPSTLGQSYPTRKLYLYSNLLTDDGISDKSFAGFHIINTLSLSLNKLTQFPNLKYIGPTVNTVGVDKNSLNNLSLDCMAELTALRILTLRKNLFEEFPNFTFAGLPEHNRLERIYLSSNKISKLEQGSLIRLHALEILDLNDNNIKTIIPLAELSPFLNHLDLSWNNIDYIDDDTLAEVSLHDLILSHNNISKIPKLTKSQSSLTYLDLSYNPINSMTSADELAAMMTSFQNMKHLFLEGIGLTILPEIAVDTLKELHIKDNPLVCHKKSCWIRDRQEDGLIVTGMGPIYCNIPGGMVEWNLVPPWRLCAQANPLAGYAIVTQSSMWNSNVADFAIDGDSDTCAVTGYESNPWLRLEFTRHVLVNGTTINGFLPEGPTITIRVGNIGHNIGSQVGHQKNPVCVSKGYDIQSTGTDLYILECNSPLLGQYLDVEIIAGTGGIGQLGICEITVF